ncbi:hypothetical protein M427DRAFT_32909 [Gonapodya prolifera JEL478]|uniref:Uncharacterized protein n=1 Tax=Gonapodya prolifera (strain JEL478) TaxID=1344416 RepID=A0A139AD10_GONPJ|nr:hypothetical protein M427DRAFT_32909 [Gonapodya prolifera JEL478]|eukprot:KXS14702.1 hypothetical protein M427DRAFT_32909 [Gonapodya prolifera JEL478]
MLGVFHKLVSVTTNNGSNNNTMMRAVADMDGISKDFDAIDSHVHEESMVEATESGQKPVEKDPNTTQLYKEYTTQFTNPSKHLQELVALVTTRWRSNYNTIVWALADHIKINNLIAKENGLWKWKLMDADWEYLKHMKVLLMKVEAAKIPTLYMVVPVFNLLGWMAEENWEQEFIGWARELLQAELDQIAPSSALVTPQGNPAFLDNNLEWNSWVKEYTGRDRALPGGTVAREGPGCAGV